MGKLNKLYIRLFNSPRNFDEISFKRTKALLYNTIIIGIISWIISIVIIYKDSSLIQTSMDTQVQNKTTLPQIIVTTRNTNIHAFSVNNFTIDQDFNQINFSNYQYCIGGVPLSSSLCYNQQEANHNLTYFGSSYSGSQLVINPFDLIYNETYLNINFQQLNISNQLSGQLSLGWLLQIDNITYSFTAPIKVQVIFKIEILVDEFGNQDINYIPNIVTSILYTPTCSSYIDGQQLDNCFENNLSFFYQTSIVTIYSKETPSQLLLRIAKDIFSLGKVLLVLVSLALSFLTTKFFFKKRSSWFENYIRDAVLYHFHYHELESNNNSDDNNSSNYNNKENDNISSETIELISNKEKENRNCFGKIKVSIKKMLRSIPYQDQYSEKLSFLSKIQVGAIILTMLSISIFTIVKDFNVNVLNISYLDYDSLELPEFSFSYESINNASKLWFSYEEILNNNHYNCTMDLNLKYKCTNQPIGAIPNLYQSSAYYNSTLQLGRGQEYSFLITSFLFDTSNFNKTDPTFNPEIFDYVYIKFNLNNVEYYMKPYYNITIQLTKTIFHQPYQDIISYEPSFISAPSPYEYSQINNTVYLGFTYLNILYSTNIVKEINMDTLFQKLVRLASYIGAFSSPVMIVIPFLFTRIISKLLFKNSSTHVQFDIREAILYHLYNYNKYKSIFKKNKNKNHSQKELYSSKNYTLEKNKQS